MKVTVSKLPKSEIKIRIEVSAENTAKYKEEILRQFRAKMQVPGFRQGKVPLHIIEEKIGEKELFAHLSERILIKTYAEAVKKEDLQVVCRPHVHIVSKIPFVYEVTVAVLPDITMKGLSDIKIPKKEVNVSDKDIETVLEDIRKQNALKEDVDRAIEKGDRVEIDFEGFDEKGVKLEGTESKNHPVIVGDGVLVEDFEKNLIGMKKNEDKKFSIRFPKDYRHKPFQGKKVEFHVRVSRVQNVVLPDLDEALIEKFTGKKTDRNTFEKEVRENLLQYKEADERRKRENELLEKLLEIASFEVSDILIEEEIDFQIENITMDMKEKGVEKEEYLKILKEKGQDLRKNLRKRAEHQVRTRFVLQYIFQQQKFDVTDQEVDKALKEYTGKEPFTEVQMRNQLLISKMFDYYLK